jgi:predicted PurR-regulated permease PerM
MVMDSGQRFYAIAVLVVLSVFALTIYVSQLFLSTIFFSVIIMFILMPLYKGIYRVTKRSVFASMATLSLVFVGIFIIILSVANLLASEIMDPKISQDLAGLSISSISTDMDIWMKLNLPAYAAPMLGFLGNIPSKISSSLLPAVQGWMGDFASSLPVLFSQLLVVIFLTYYVLIDGKHFLDYAVEFVPESRKPAVVHFLIEINDIYTSLFSVYFVTSMLSGVIAAVGFFIMGIGYPFTLGAVIAIATLVPLIGSPIIFIPLAIYYALTKKLLMSIIIIVFGIVFLMIIPENVIRPGLARKRAKINPILTVLAYTAPVFQVGPMGVIIGPALYGFLLAAYRTAVWHRESSRETGLSSISVDKVGMSTIDGIAALK